ncbi:hypothetical protein AHiyo1_00280 [Arthrobacter sp. Hiyo1]|nr:hypothetical protein AHiyo1_00280 [Arthrobacter sp. Hiyo1]
MNGDGMSCVGQAQVQQHPHVGIIQTVVAIRPRLETETTRWARRSRNAWLTALSLIAVVAARSHTHSSPPSNRDVSNRKRPGSPSNENTSASSAMS